MGNNRTEMFSSLLLYQDSAFAAAHNKLYLAFPDEEGEREYTIFSVMNLDTGNSSFDYILSDFESDEEKGEFLDYLETESLYVPDDRTEISRTGQTVILSTCNRVYGQDNRLLICAAEVTE